MDDDYVVGCLLIQGVPTSHEPAEEPEKRPRNSLIKPNTNTPRSGVRIKKRAGDPLTPVVVLGIMFNGGVRRRP